MMGLKWCTFVTDRSLGGTQGGRDEQPTESGTGDLMAAQAPVVIKLGSALLSTRDGLNSAGISAWCTQIAAALAAGQRIVVVSSGAVAAGTVGLGLAARPSEMRYLQAAAAVGQLELMNAYTQALAAHGLKGAMVLLTHADIANRSRYLNARNTLLSLLDMGVIPIVNENDSVATDEIRFGDNDTLAAMVANLLEARLLVLLTDQAGLHERDPREDPSAPLVRTARASDPALAAMAGAAGQFGQGGMQSKVKAAQLAARSGADTVIGPGRQANVITDLLAGVVIGTRLHADLAPLDARKRWIADQQRPKGDLMIDAGAVTALREQGVSLLPIGVTAVEGGFQRGDLVRCVGPSGVVIAQGLVNYDAQQAALIAGSNSKAIAGLLGFAADPELVHRDNLVVF